MACSGGVYGCDKTQFLHYANLITFARMKTMTSFDNTEVAFAHCSDKELKHAHWLFNMMGKPWLVRIGTKLAPWSLNAGLPVKGLIRKTIFTHFVGGETLEETIPVVNKMGEYHVAAILDYGVEGKEGEANYDHARDEFIRVIKFAATQKNIPFMSVKVTGIARFALLEKIHSLMQVEDDGSLISRYNAALQKLSLEELNEWQKVYNRIKDICETAKANNIGFLVDAEETWIQDPLDALIMLMMVQYNTNKIVIWNTLQMYRHDRLAFLKKSYEAAVEKNFLLGMKLVRGAYIERERRRAAEKGYTDPIHADKAGTDRDYDDAVKFCIDHVDRVGVMVASHNETSNLVGVGAMEQKGLPLNHPHVHFSQLFGMSDNITYNLAKIGCNVSKYLPFGPIKDVVPYLMRRAEENTSVGGQTSRELNLIEKEMKRRGHK
jgi:proline dehydrogenase